MESVSPPDSARRSVLIVEDDTFVRLGLRTNLEKFGYTVAAQASTVVEAVALYRAHKPEFVLLDIRLGTEDGIDLAAQLLKERRCPMLILSAYSDRELVERATAAGVFGYLIKPVSAEALQAQLEVARHRFLEHESLLREKDSLAQTLETRKLVERAKGIFMKRMQLDEADAHRRLQQESQRRRIGLAELAKRVIESEDLLGGPGGAGGPGKAP